MNLPNLIPWWWKAGAAAALVLALGAAHVARVHAAHAAGRQEAIDERAARDAVAIIRRTQDNAALAAKQDAINVAITKAKNEELAPVVQRIYVDRVRVGAAICGGPAAPAQAKSAGSGDGADSAGRLVPQRTEEDIRALEEAVERHMATGRACQAFVRENGLAP